MRSLNKKYCGSIFSKKEKVKTISQGWAADKAGAAEQAAKKKFFKPPQTEAWWKSSFGIVPVYKGGKWMLGDRVVG